MAQKSNKGPNFEPYFSLSPPFTSTKDFGLRPSGPTAVQGAAKREQLSPLGASSRATLVATPSSET